MKAAVLFTGGKDSTYAAYKALESGLEIRYLITMVPRNPHSLMFHWANTHCTQYQAEAMGIKQVLRYTSGEQERELEDLRKAISIVKADVDGVISGAIASTYQKNRISAICSEFGLTHIAPLWSIEPATLLREIIVAGFEPIITVVAAEGLTKKWLGRKIDDECVDDLVKLHDKYKINISGEGGEYESLVLDAPFFKSRIKVVDAEKIWRGTSGYYLVKRAEIEGK